ncbi:BQ5605_C033g11138 [Microbotryum silenes-dioicae]|uniref:BQ5605_C033g11138 protein n=1 Tax=Microbotryum silenes-dioicae TaxID=796604 RepID=A0A2X0PB96_9BASI|nr:BQ5605_C033g11138 [Microbotryum silenes-dioicae]
MPSDHRLRAVLAEADMAMMQQSQFLGQSAHAIASTSRISLPSYHSVIAAPPQANGANNTNPFPSHLLNTVGAPASVPEVSTDPSSEQQSVYDALSLFTGPHNQTVPSYGADNYAWTDSAMLKFDFNLLSALELGQDELRVTEPFETDHEHLFHHPSRMTTGSTSLGSDANAHQIRSASTSYLGTPTHSASSPSTSLPLDEHMPHYFTVYFDRFWQLFPIVNRQRLTAQVQANEHRRPGPIAQLVLSIAALVETSDYLENSPHDGDPMNTRVGPVLSYARTTVFSPLREEDVQLDQVIAVMNLFVAEDILGNRRAGWYRLQEAITLAQVLQLDQIPQHARALDGSDQAAIEGLKTFYILFICERATSMLQRLPTIVHRPLRLPDNAYQLTQQRLSALPPSLFSGFPMPHLRLFSLINSQVLSCWHGTCSVAPNGCTAWSVDKALALQRDLANEFTSALNMYRSALNAVPSTNGIQNVNLVVTTAWLPAVRMLTFAKLWNRSRFWNICQAHGLVHRDSGPELSPAYPFKILRELVDLFDHFKSSDTDAALDWGAKLYDMAMTGIRIVSQEQLVITPKSTSPNSVNESIRSPLKQQLMPILFKILGLLTMYKHAQDKLLPNLVKALATIS